MRGVVREKIITVRLVQEMIGYRARPWVGQTRVSVRVIDWRIQHVDREFEWALELTLMRSPWQRRSREYSRKSTGYSGKRGCRRLVWQARGRAASRTNHRHFRARGR